MDEYPKSSLVGEVWMHDQAQISYWQKDSPISAIQNYNTYLPQVMDFTLHDAVQEAFKENNQGWDKGMARVYENFVNDFLYKNASENLIFLENHDTQRFNETYPKMADYKLAMALLATTRGIPQIYYGSEIGMKGDKNNGGDASIRQDFPGGWKEDTKNAFTKEGRSDFQENYFQFTKKLLNWRKNNSIIHEGKLVQFLPENNVYVYFRVKGKEKVMVVINNSDKEEKIKKATVVWGIKESIFKIKNEKGISFPNHIFEDDFSFEDKKATATLKFNNKEEKFQIQFDSVEDYIFVCAFESINN
jgi:glycosidase